MTIISTTAEDETSFLVFAARDPSMVPIVSPQQIKFSPDICIDQCDQKLRENSLR